MTTTVSEDEEVAETVRAKNKALDFSQADERAFFRRIFGKAEGYVAVARGPKPKAVDHMIKWPDDADELLAVDGSRGAFFRPVLRETPDLSDRHGLKGSTPTLVWALWVDVDQPITDTIRREAEALGGLFVQHVIQGADYEAKAEYARRMAEFLKHEDSLASEAEFFRSRALDFEKWKTAENER